MHGSYKIEWQLKVWWESTWIQGQQLAVGYKNTFVMHLVFIHGRGRWWSSSSGNASAYDPSVIIFFQVTITAVSGRWLPIHGWGRWPWRWLWGVKSSCMMRIELWLPPQRQCASPLSQQVLLLFLLSEKKKPPLYQLYQQQFCITACNPNSRKCCKPTKWALDQNLTRVTESWGAWGCMSFLHAELPSQLAQSCSLLLTLLTTSLHL
jgi:hypothetical protein